MNSFRKSRLSPAFKCAMVTPRELSDVERREMDLLFKATQAPAFAPVAVTAVQGGLAFDVEPLDHLLQQPLNDKVVFQESAFVEWDSNDIRRLNERLVIGDLNIEKTFGVRVPEVKPIKEKPKAKASGLINALIQRL